MQRKKLLIKILFVIIVFLTGCSVKDNQSSKKETIKVDNLTSKQIDKNGEIVLSIRQPKTLNPLINEDSTIDNMLKLVFEPFFILNNNLKPIPNLASNYSISETGTKITIDVKDNIYWHDGTPITTEDIIYSLNTIKNNSNSIYYKNLEYIKDYSSNGKSIIINYKEPYSFSLYNLCFPVIPKHYYENKSGENQENLETIGSGMFKFSKYNIAKSIILEKNTNFKGTPKISKINCIISDSKETDLNSFERNITNFISVDVSNIGKLDSSKNINVQNLVNNNFEFLGFNLKNEILKNINLRKAISYAIPKNEILNNIYLNKGNIADTIVNPKSWLYNKDVLKYNYDLEEAKKYLKLSKLDLSKESLSILVNEENNERIEVAEIISNRLNSIGIKTYVEKKSFEEYKKLLEEDNFYMFLGGIEFDSVPDYKSFLTYLDKSDLSLNYNNIESEYMNELVLKVYSAINEEELVLAMKDLQQYCNEYVGFVGILFKDYLLLTNENIYTSEGNRYNYFTNIEEWYIKE